MQCELCGKEVKGLKYHMWRMHGDGKTHDPGIGYKTGNRQGWNKGLTKETDNRIKIISEKVSKSLTGKPGAPRTEKQKEHLSKIAIEREFGCKNRNKYAHGWYISPFAGKVWLESSYEHLVAQSLDEAHIFWLRPKSIPYVLNGKSKRYFPDFYLVEYDVYLDPKNDYLIRIDSEKIEAVKKQNKVQIIVLDKNNLTWENIARLV